MVTKSTYLCKILIFKSFILKNILSIIFILVKSVEDKLNDLGMYELLEYAQAAGLINKLTKSGNNYTILAPNADSFKSEFNHFVIHLRRVLSFINFDPGHALCH